MVAHMQWAWGELRLGESLPPAAHGFPAHPGYSGGQLRKQKGGWSLRGCYGHGRGPHPTHLPTTATPQPCSTLTTREFGKLYLNMCPGGKGYGFGKELVSFCHQGLQND